MTTYTILHNGGYNINYDIDVYIVRMHNDATIRVMYDTDVDMSRSFVSVDDALDFLYDYMG